MNPVLLIAIPLLAALLAVFLKKIDKILLYAAAVLNVAAAIVAAALYAAPQVIIIGGFKPPFGISLVLDGYSLTGILLINVIFALIVLLSSRHVGKYAIVLCVALAALNGMVLTGDLFNLFVFMEIAAIAAYIITSANKDLKHTFNYLVVGTLASGLFLFGIVLIYAIFGSLNMMDIKDKITAAATPVQKALILPLVMIFAGLAVEAKLIPFGGWVKGVLKKANPLVGAAIVSAYALAVLLVFGRLFSSVFVVSGELLTAFSVVASATLVLAETSAFSSKNMREVLLFSSIAQSGLAVMLFLQGLTLPGVLVLVSNVVSKLVLFTIAGKLADDLGTDEIEKIKGVFSRYPLVGIGFTISTLSLIGIPLFFGFSAKLNTLIALFDGGNYWLPAIILLMAVVEGSYYIRMLASLWHAGAEGEISAKDGLSAYQLKSSGIISAVVLLIGLLIIAAGILTLSNVGLPAAADFTSFIKQSLGGM